MTRKLLLLVAALATGSCAQSGGTTTFPGIVQVCDKPSDCPTANVATASGELLVEGDIEADGNLNVAGTSTLSGAVTASTTLAVTGNSTFTGAARAVSGAITGVTALDADDCGKTFSVSAGIDGAAITLPDADAVLGCDLTFSYIGADAGALVDITPLDSDADGIEGGCYETATDTVVYFSGTADADIGLTKTTALTGDYIKLVACDAAMWCVVGCMGIWANN